MVISASLLRCHLFIGQSLESRLPPLSRICSILNHLKSNDFKTNNSELWTTQYILVHRTILSRKPSSALSFGSIMVLWTLPMPSDRPPFGLFRFSFYFSRFPLLIVSYVFADKLSIIFSARFKLSVNSQFTLFFGKYFTSWSVLLSLFLPTYHLLFTSSNHNPI